ncbi:hypothetical protein AAMO2058_001214100 [Amorphochlora amoebiformis]
MSPDSTAPARNTTVDARFFQTKSLALRLFATSTGFPTSISPRKTARRSLSIES